MYVQHLNVAYDRNALEICARRYFCATERGRDSQDQDRVCGDSKLHEHFISVSSGHSEAGPPRTGTRDGRDQLERCTELHCATGAAESGLSVKEADTRVGELEIA